MFSYSDFPRASDSTIETTTGSLPLREWSDKSLENSREGHNGMSHLSSLQGSSIQTDR